VNPRRYAKEPPDKDLCMSRSITHKDSTVPTAGEPNKDSYEKEE